MSEFILFDNFMLKKSEILYAIKHHEEKKIEVMTRNSRNEEKKFTMTFHSNYSMNETYTRLSIDLDAHMIEENWRHPLVIQIFNMRSSVSMLDETMEKLKSETAQLRKELRKQRLLK